jgi:hypothetical protein
LVVDVVEPPRVVGVVPVVPVGPIVGTVAGLVVSVVAPRTVLDVLGTGSATVVDTLPTVVDGDPNVVLVRCCRRTDNPDDFEVVLSAQLLRVSAAAMAAMSTASTVTASTP